jgi:hypothetical protein
VEPIGAAGKHRSHGCYRCNWVSGSARGDGSARSGRSDWIDWRDRRDRSNGFHRCDRTNRSTRRNRSARSASFVPRNIFDVAHIRDG